MRGKKELTPSFFPRLAHYLQLDHHEIAEAQRLLLERLEQNQLAGETGIHALSRESEKDIELYQPLDPTSFWLLQEWYHIPVLNLLTTKGAASAIPSWIAKRLGISASQAEESVERLVSEGFLRRSTDGTLSRTELKIRFPTARSHASIRKFHHIMIGKAMRVLEAEPSPSEFSQRLLSGISFAANPTKIGDAKLVLEEAMYRAVEILSEGDCAEVFQINLQLFKISQ
jgi:uncharacterized protein (TIGR02147 family)